MPRKTFADGDPLPAADLNTYLMDQSVQTYASSGARNTALPSPVEGQVVYIADIDRFEFYNGSAWFAVSGKMPRYEIKLGSTFSITNGTTAVVTGWTSISNTGGFSGTAGVITVPTTGRYNMTYVCIHTANNTTGTRGALINLSTTGVTYRDTHPAPANVAHSQSIFLSMNSIEMNQGDTVTLQAHQTSGVTNTLTTDTFFVIEFIGA